MLGADRGDEVVELDHAEAAGLRATYKSQVASRLHAIADELAATDVRDRASRPRCTNTQCVNTWIVDDDGEPTGERCSCVTRSTG